jgi:NAD(P)-dependent dehydrogenase (short-subunit alcohol dehydrogenase family)
MKNKLCIVTGASSGIGLETCIGLAKQGAHVVMTARDAQRGEAARKKVWQACPEAKADLLLSDFASLASVRELAATVFDRYERIDVLINNAGLTQHRRRETADGHEMTFQVNHLAPFLLTNLLLERLQHSGSSRIVTVASVAHKKATLDFDDLETRRGYTMWKAYSRSKLANILFTRELARRLAGTSVTANCLHPGLVATNIVGRFLPSRVMWKLMTPFILNAEKGAATSIHLATSPDVEGVSGAYFDKCETADTSAAAKNMDDARRLWEASAQMVGR